jgi:restriction endonuclease Mrr
MLPVLRSVGDRQEHPIAQLRTQIAAQLNLMEAELTQRLASDSQTVFASRVAWAVQYLKQAGVLIGVRRGV